MKGSTSLPTELTRRIEAALGSRLIDCQMLGAGSFARTARLTLGGTSFFLKYGPNPAAQTFEAEALGLQTLAQARSPLVIPKVRAVDAGDTKEPGFILLDWLDQGTPDDAFWEAFGTGLASLHQNVASQYGFEQDNFIGLTPQQNTWEVHWTDFFIKHRLIPQKNLAHSQGRWDTRWDQPFANLSLELESLLPPTPAPSLLHGDLWQGNFLATQEGNAALIDPAVYYGHREADLAMTRLFGGFPERFYQTYQAAWSLEPGFQERFEVYNLYHLLNHLNLFGGHYAASVARVLAAFR